MRSRRVKLSLVTALVGVPAGVALAWGSPPGVSASDGRPREQAPRLEFRIVANDRDDKDAFAASRKMFAASREDARVRQALRERARQGQPPPTPKPARGERFATPLGRFTYHWVKLAPAELRALNLTGPAATDPDRNALARQAARARDRGEAFRSPQGFLLYSRPGPGKDREKTFAYFMLLRDPEPGKAITGKYLREVKAGNEERPSINFALSKRGGELLHELTSKNKPTRGNQEFHRHLAILFDGSVAAAFVVRDPIRDRGMITGRFDREEVRALVKALRDRMPTEK